MLIKCSKKVRFPHPDDKSKDMVLEPGFIGEVPKWVEDHWYFNALAKDGSITIIKGKTDADIRAAIEPEGKNQGDDGDKEPGTPETPPETSGATGGDKKPGGKK